MAAKQTISNAVIKASLDRDALLRALIVVNSVVERDMLDPILRHVRLTAGECIELLATDMDLTLRASVPADVTCAGAAAVPAGTLLRIARTLPAGSTVAIEHEPGASELQLSVGRAQFVLPTMPADEFPATSGDELEVNFEIAPGELAELIDTTSFAISTEETRYYLNGIYFHVAGAGDARTLRAVASDGHRLAMAEVPLPPGAERLPRVIVPRKTVKVLRRLLDAAEAAEEAVRVAVSEVRIAVTCAGARLVSRLIDGEYPRYERVIPADNDRVVMLARQSFVEAVRRVASISLQKSQNIKLSFEAGRVTVSADGYTQGRAREDLDCDWHGESFEIGFNARYVLDIVSRLDGPELMLAMAGPREPVLVRDPSDQDTLVVLMPTYVS